MRRLSGLHLALACLALIGGLHAQSDPDGRGADPSPAAGAKTPSPPPPPRPSQGPREVFNPSEKIRADSAVTLPVDI